VDGQTQLSLENGFPRTHVAKRNNGFVLFYCPVFSFEDADRDIRNFRLLTLPFWINFVP
jgi:hypothetical protein